MCGLDGCVTVLVAAAGSRGAAVTKHIPKGRKLHRVPWENGIGTMATMEAAPSGLSRNAAPLVGKSGHLLQEHELVLPPPARSDSSTRPRGQLDGQRSRMRG